MSRKYLPYWIAAAVLLAVVMAAAVATNAFLSPLSGNSVLGAGTADDKVQTIAGCESDPAALSAFEGKVQTAEAAELGVAGESGQAWRLHSVCKQGDWAYAFVKGYQVSARASLPLDDSPLLIAQRTADGWQVVLPGMGPAYNQALEAVPETLIPGPAKALLAQPPAAPSLRFSSFALPWPSGESAYVIWHWYPALDFSIGSAAGTRGTIRNAKAGTAVFVKDSSTRECGSPPPDWYCWMSANAVVIQSGPNEFAWYLHLVTNSVPDWIQEGVYVPAGADIGVEGATGWAVSPHLHFQVASTYSCCDGEGDSRIPHWPFSSMGRVDFIEYSWESLPWQAFSQNGLAAEPAPSAPQPDDPVIVEVAAVEPPPEPPPAPPVSESQSSNCPNPYTVQRGEWLLKIAESCGVSLSAIVAANPGLNPQLIYAGQALSMPGGSPPAASAPPPPPEETATPPPAPAAPAVAGASCTGTHVVAAGENLFRIAFNCGLTTQEMATLNSIAYPYTIYPGQSLQFPQP